MGMGLRELIGVDKACPIEAWVPMFLFAIVFGLSMDYEVFLLSRIKEQDDRTRDNATAVADGLAVTAPLITAAALEVPQQPDAERPADELTFVWSAGHPAGVS